MEWMNKWNDEEHTRTMEDFLHENKGGGMEYGMEWNGFKEGPMESEALNTNGRMEHILKKKGLCEQLAKVVR